MWRGFKKSPANSGSAGIAVDDSHVTYARVRQGAADRLEVVAACIDNNGANDDWARRLAVQVGSINAGPPVFSSLPQRSYQLLLVELPNVPSDEVADAIRWQVKDLLDFPVSESVIEILDMPAHLQGTDDKAMAYAVATRRGNVDDHIAFLSQAGVAPHVISIPELCARNIATMLPQDASGVAFLHLSEERGFLTVSRQGLLYLIRHIDMGRKALRTVAEGTERVDLLATFALEIQRSLDYYESHFDRRPLTEFVLAPGSDVGGLAKSLDEQLGLTVSCLDFNELFDLQNATSLEEQGDCLLAIGAALGQRPLAA